MDDILDVDLLAFENGSDSERAAVVDGVTRSLATGFVFTKHDVGEDVLDTAYGMLAEFFSRSTEEKNQYNIPDSHAQTGYTGLLVETAASADVADWKEMLNWGAPLGAHHPLRAQYPFRFREPVLPEKSVPGIHDVLLTFHRRIFDIQRRFLRVIALGIGCHENFFDEMLTDGPTLTRAIR